MNNDKKPKKTGDRKRFYTALYSCAGIMIALASAISISNIKEMKNLNEKNKTQNEAKVEITAENTAEKEIEKAVSNSKDESFKEKENPTETQKQTSNTQNNTQKIEPSTQNQTQNETETKSENSSTKTDKATQSTNKDFALFDESKEMSWPVDGEIVMDYSMETAIYDKTLEQYRTNDSISISAEVGQEVKAAADGIVENIFEDSENGKSVVINHGNGWSTTYSQLQNNLLVDIGQVVSEGEVIGNVGEPSNYGVALGSHLDFKITQNEQATDPKIILAQYND